MLSRHKLYRCSDSACNDTILPALSDTEQMTTLILKHAVRRSNYSPTRELDNFDSIERLLRQFCNA
jgi:hypothetical protein